MDCGVNWGVGSWWWKVTTHLLLSLFPLRSTVLYILINYSTFCSEKVYYHLARFSGFDKLHLKNTLTGHFCTISTLTCADACQWIFPTFPPCFITLIDHSLSGQSVRSHAQSTLQLKVPRHILTYMSKLYPSDGWVTTHRRWFGIWQCGLYVVKAQSLLYNSIEWVQNSCFHSSIVSFLLLFSLWHFFSSGHYFWLQQCSQFSLSCPWWQCWSWWDWWRLESRRCTWCWRGQLEVGGHKIRVVSFQSKSLGAWVAQGSPGKQ